MKEKAPPLPAARGLLAVLQEVLPARLATRLIPLPVSAHTVALWAILAVAALARLWGLNALGLNSDEAVYAGQAAAIARDPLYAPLFPIFRAHPLLFQFLLSLFFRWGVIDWAGRLLGAAFGLGAVFLAYRTGKVLYGDRAGLYAALFLALMPYHVVGSRQALLDAPMTFFVLMVVYFVARYAEDLRPAWLYAMSAALGLAVLAKETGVLFIASLYLFIALSPEIRLRLRHLAGSSLVFLLVVAPYPLSILFARGGGSQNAPRYLIWQFFRQPNHPWDFYLRVVPAEIGPLLLLCAILGLILLFRSRSWRETLLLSWILVPILFFQFWPTKGYLYLLPLAPPLSLLAGRFLAAWFPSRSLRWAGRSWGSLQLWAAGVVMLSLLLSTTPVFFPAQGGRFLAGSGGVEGGREAGTWLRSNTPAGTHAMTIGPSMANILQFYGHRSAQGLSVSPNPLYRNPSYQPILNPDLHIRRGELQYVVWDVYSASRSSFFSEKLMEYVQKYNGRVVHVQTASDESSAAGDLGEPVIIIYEVRP